jgi:hypothetical protein
MKQSFCRWVARRQANKSVARIVHPRIADKTCAGNQPAPQLVFLHINAKQGVCQFRLDAHPVFYGRPDSDFGIIRN